MKNYSLTLSQLCNLQFGANTSVNPTGDIACLQTRNFSDNGEFLNNEIHYAPESAFKYTDYLKPNQILFSSKGRIFAAVWKGEVEKVIASGTFIIITIKSNSILPEYLALYLNSIKAKRYIDYHIKQGTVPHIGKKDLELLPVEVPNLEKQNLFIKLHSLMTEENNLNIELKEKRENVINHLI